MGKKIQINGNENIIGDNNTIIKAQKIVHKPLKIEIVYDENVYLSPEQKFKIQEKIKEIVEMSNEKNSSSQYARIYGALKKQFKVSTYKEITKDNFEDVMKFLQKMQVQTRNSLFKKKPKAYKENTIKAIYTMWKKIDEHENIYEFVEKKLNKKVDSLKKLSAEDISKLYQRVYYVYKKEQNNQTS